MEDAKRDRKRNGEAGIERERERDRWEIQRETENGSSRYRNREGES